MSSSTEPSSTEPSSTEPSSTEPGRPRATRDRERTRAAIVASAERLLRERGTGFAIADAAQGAGVSKSGLLHHFPSRDALILAVAEHALTSMHDDVLAHVDLAENRPGKLLRGYVRALCGGSTGAMELFAPSPVWAAIAAVDGVEQLMIDDAQRWRELLGSDGLPADRVLVVRFAAEGVAASVGLPGYLHDDELRRVREALLALAEPEV